MYGTLDASTDAAAEGFETTASVEKMEPRDCSSPRKAIRRSSDRADSCAPRAAADIDSTPHGSS